MKKKYDKINTERNFRIFNVIIYKKKKNAVHQDFGEM